MDTRLCHEFLAEADCELTNAALTHTITLPDHTVGRHLECKLGHKFHLGQDGQKWPCDCE